MTTAIEKICPDCRASVPPAAPEGLCPRCLAQAVITLQGPGTTTTDIANIAAQRFFGDYELLEEVARGGAGIVFKARQLGVNRIVALKILAGGAAAGRDFIHRFHTEASTAARLEHPNIVPIFEFGEHEGAHFLAMRFLEGGTLQAAIRENRPTPKETARLMMLIGSAVEHAHRRGILHRDLKPGNILLDGDGTPHVADFGLARLVEDDSNFTLSHALIGTVSYLPPEIAERGAASATTASDIYGLGAILYESLTGEPPFMGASMAETLLRIRDTDPTAPSQLNPGIPRDLETICLKCLEKDPVRRYATPQEFVDELGRFMDGEPILARPVSRTERMTRWCQRKPALATASFLILILIVGSPLAAYRINETRKAEAAARKRAEQNSYASDMLLTQAALGKNNLGQALGLLERYVPNRSSNNPVSFTSKPRSSSDFRGWEWYHYFEQTKGDELFILGRHATNGVVAAGILPDGETAWSAGRDRTIRVWNISKRRAIAVLHQDEPFYDAAQSPDGHWLVTISGTGLVPGNHRMCLWDLTVPHLVRVLSTNRFPRKLMAFSPDNKLIAYENVQDGIHIMDRDSAREVAFLQASRNLISPLGFAFCPGRPVVAYAPDRFGTILLWNFETKMSEGVLTGHTDVVQAIVFSPDGRRLASAALDGILRFWDPSSKRELAHLDLSNVGTDIWPIVFSPQGDLLALVDSSGQAKLLDALTGAPVTQLRGHRAGVNTLAFAPDGRTLISASGDDTVRVWSRDPKPRAKTSQTLPPDLLVTPHRSHMYSLSPGGLHLITVFTDGTYSTWDTVTFTQGARRPLPGTNLVQEAISPDGSLVAFALQPQGSEKGWDVVVWNLSSNQPLFWTGLRLTSGIGRIRFSPDGKRLAFGAWPRIYVFNLAAKQQTHAFTYSQRYPYDLVAGLAFSNEGPYLGATTHSGWALAWNLQTSNLQRAVLLPETLFSSALFSADNRFLFAGGSGTAFLAIDLQSATEIPPLNPAPGATSTSAISPDGKTLALAEGTQIGLWNLASLNLVGQLAGHHQQVRALEFSSDGQALVSVSYDEIRRWRATTSRF